MQKSVLYGIIAAAIIAAGVGIAFATMSMNNTSDTNSQLSPQQQSSDDNNVRVIKHELGETEITGTPTRIVALDWSASEILLAMDVSPIGVASLENMKELLRPEGLSPDIADVGTIEEPNLEAIAELEPDLILGAEWSQSGIYEELSSIAPTVMYDNAPPLDGSPTHLELLEQNIILVADAANKRDKGVEIVDGLHAKYEEAAGKIEAAGLKGQKFVVGAVDPPYGDYAFSTLRFFDSTFFMSQMMSRLGLENAVTEEYGLENWGMKVVNLEGLATVDGSNVHFFYIHAEGQDAFETEWKDSPVWNDLEMAKNGNMHPLGTLYVFGGPKQMEEMVDKVVKTLTSGNETRTISHDMGETTITGTPERIVTMSQVAYGILLELGVQPVGADLWQKGSPQNPEDPVYWEQYFPGIAEEWPDVVNVGNSGEPNLEVIASLEPDLILDSDWALGKNYDDLNAIAPTIAYFRNAELDTDITPLDQLERHTMGIANALNRHEEGVAMVERMNANFAEEKAKLEEAGLAGEKFLFLQTFAIDSIFALTPDSRQSHTLEAIGLVNALPSEGFVEGGRIAIGLEQLAELDAPDLHVIYIYYGQDPVPTLEDNPVWSDLSFVQDGRIYTVGTPPPEPAVDIWGGPQTQIQFVDKVVEVMTSNN